VTCSAEIEPFFPSVESSRMDWICYAHIGRKISEPKISEPKISGAQDLRGSMERRRGINHWG
jgi:hypothetical protein